MYFEFVCSDCGERTVVDGHVREVMQENGCVVCGGTVTDAAFDRIEG